MIAMVVDDRTTVGDAIAIVDYLLLDSILDYRRKFLTSTWRFPVKAYVGIQYLELCHMNLTFGGWFYFI